MTNFERAMVQQVVDSLQCASAICESSRTWHARTRYGVCEVTPHFSTRVPYAGRGVARDWRSLHDEDTEGEILFSRRIRQGNVHPRSLYVKRRMMSKCCLSVLPETNVLYMTRIQMERFSSQEEYDKVMCTQDVYVKRRMMSKCCISK